MTTEELGKIRRHRALKPIYYDFHPPPHFPRFIKRTQEPTSKKVTMVWAQFRTERKQLNDRSILIRILLFALLAGILITSAALLAKKNDTEGVKEQADYQDHPPDGVGNSPDGILAPTSYPSLPPSNSAGIPSFLPPTSESIAPMEPSEICTLCSKEPTSGDDGVSNDMEHAPTTAPTSHPMTDPTSAPTTVEQGTTATYRPGELTVMEAGLLLSTGLSAKLIASSGKVVEFTDGTASDIPFHGLPDGAATFEDTREWNQGGWIYVSNSEMKEKGEGGVGAITFNKHGEVVEYKMILTGTTMNCSGGRTPWGTWVSCEEVEFDGQIWQVDPFGERQSQVLTLGNTGGMWEAFAYDIRDLKQPRFFVTEDHNKGCLRRFTPSEVNWDRPWDMLHGAGVTEYMIVHPTSDEGGTFEWTSDEEAAKNNARTYYPLSEGIDVYGSQLFFVCKKIHQIFTINLDEGTYTNETTISGLFDGKPDQVHRILDDDKDILYFTEEGGVDAVSTIQARWNIEFSSNAI